MTKFLFSAAMMFSVAAGAQGKFVFSGSDTLAGVMTDAIIAAGMDSQVQYAGGGSGLAEKALLTGDQGVAPMSREIKPEVLAELQAKGNSVIANVIALDGIAIFVKDGNNVASLDLQTVTRIFTCELTKWEQIPGASAKGDIRVVRRNDASGTTDAFKHFTGVKKFGDCVQALNETADIAEATARDPQAIGYAGLSGKSEHNKIVAIAAKAGSPAVMPTTSSIRDFSYPMARRLYVYEITGANLPNEVEQNLLMSITDRSFMDPIVQAHEFITID